jgi:hypothetical protein
MRLLENRDLLAQTGAGNQSGGSALRHFGYISGLEVSLGSSRSSVGDGGVRGRGQSVTYVPGFWSVKGVNSTVLTSISFQC